MNDRLLDLMHRWVTAPLHPVPRPVLDDPEQRHFGHVIHLRAVASAREGWFRVRDELEHLTKHSTLLDRAARRVAGVDHGPRDRAVNIANHARAAALVADSHWVRRMTS